MHLTRSSYQRLIIKFDLKTEAIHPSFKLLEDNCILADRYDINLEKSQEKAFIVKLVPSQENLIYPSSNLT